MRASPRSARLPRRALLGPTYMRERNLTDYPTRRLDHYGANLIHSRLPELMKLADAAEPFYEWVQAQAQEQMHNRLSFSDNLMQMTQNEITSLILRCHSKGSQPDIPALFDGIGRQYPHRRAVYYFFAWAARDAPQQRLQPILSRAQRAAGKDSLLVEAEALAKLIVGYRGVLKSFHWEPVREVVADRLEGSRRSVRGLAAEVVVRTAVTSALQTAYEELGGYGRFEGIRVADREVNIHGQSFDVAIDLLSDGWHRAERILIPVKSRETEGGGHSFLFTRDIDSAMNAIREVDEGEGPVYWLAAFIIAENWARDQAAHVHDVCDFFVDLPINPTEFDTLDADTQHRLNEFIRDVLAGRRAPKLARGG